VVGIDRPPWGLKRSGHVAEDTGVAIPIVTVRLTLNECSVS
jgi:hypothetical protein